MRQVKGVLFVDYVRMLRARRDIDWSTRLPAEDLELLRQRIEPDGWYPMATFERFGLAILDMTSGPKLGWCAWGTGLGDVLVATHPNLLAPGIRESLMRFHVLRGTFFDFQAIDVREIYDVEARLRIDYQMGPVAEEAATYQAMGFFERLLELSGARGLTASLPQQTWRGDASTLLVLSWNEPELSATVGRSGSA